ncbi:Scr1 family TA system antitoxin-like transcriptional regulator [Streptomyces sp. NPDC057654]|uniref:helix-turn-helix domain-containing protein n=1 Tax=Streptomyces sp. NPDC057654 TaxID=3346196 RepID=UPI0036985DCC
MVNQKELNPDGSPREAYGARLRRLREARGWKQEDLAEQVGCSSQHISAVETGRKPPTLRFSRSLDAAFGMTGDSAEAFEREWRDIRHGSMLEGFSSYVEQEGRAVEIRVFETGVIPGLLQTQEYAKVLADSAAQRRAITPQQANERVSFLMERQQALVRRRPPMLFVVMDESCLRRPIGGRAVMEAQLDRLLTFAASPTTVLQVAPFSIGERRTLNLPVNVLTMADRSVMAYAESQAQGHLDRDPTSVLPMLTAYHQLQGEVLSQPASVDMINQVRKGNS